MRADVCATSRFQRVARRVIVVPTASISDSLLQTVVWAHAGQDAEIHVVAPASNISRLDWLTNDEGDARGEALELAESTAEATPTENVQVDVGDSDPLQTIEDALRSFPADELIVVTLRDADAGWLEKGTAETALDRFSLPVTHLVVDDS